MKKRFSLFKPQQDPSNRVPDSWPRTLKRLHRDATSKLKSLRRAGQQPLSGRKSAERDDQLTMMEAMANPKKTAAVYFAMTEAKSASDGVGRLGSNPLRTIFTMNNTRKEWICFGMAN